jgi:predicted dehydrogenase
MDRDPVFGTDRATSGLLEFDGGRQLGFAVSTQAAPYQRALLVGTRGRLEIEIPFNAPPDKPCRYWIDDGSALDGTSRIETSLPAADQYELQAEAFSRAVRGEQPNATALDDAAMNMRTIDALFASARSGRFECP